VSLAAGSKLGPYEILAAIGAGGMGEVYLPADRTGLVRLDNVSVTPDGKFYAYTASRVTDSDLYVVTGWK
jgi:serine/threonine protein kinase